MGQNTTRDYGVDNIKGVLAFLMILGHLLEICAWFPEREGLYRAIYAFHMPVFVFFSGYYAKFSPKKVARYIGLYVVFQTIYCIYQSVILEGQTLNVWTVSYVRPYWLMWYMLNMVYYTMMLPLFGKNGISLKSVMISVFISLAVGYDARIGYDLSLSRFFTFMPYFLFGGYIRQNGALWCERLKNHMGIVKGLIVAFAILALAYVYRNETLVRQMFYGSVSFVERSDYGFRQRALIEGIAFLWILCFDMVVRPMLRSKIPLLSEIGRNTLAVYLLHGFFVKTFAYRALLAEAGAMQTVFVAAMLTVLLGNRWVGGAFQWICSGKMLDELNMRLKAICCRNNGR